MKTNHTTNITIGILEDDPVMQTYLQSILAKHDNISIGFAASTIVDAEAALEKGPTPDLCLVDLQLPDGNGADFVKLLTTTTSAKALILTVLGDRVSVLAALEAGAQGYLLKDTLPDQIILSIKDTLAGANPISPQAATHLLKIFKDSKPQPDKPQSDTSLTGRETEILTLFAKGFSYKEAAAVLEISPHTITDYVKSIYGKLSVHSRNEAIFEALQLGWIEL